MDVEQKKETEAEAKLREKKEVFLRMAEARFDKKDYAGAINFYTKVLELDAYDHWTYWERSIAKKNKKDFKGAINDLNKSIELNPSNEVAYSIRAEIKDKIGDKKGAENDYRKYNDLKEQKIANKNVDNIKEEVSVKEKDGRSALDYS